MDFTVFTARVKRKVSVDCVFVVVVVVVLLTVQVLKKKLLYPQCELHPVYLQCGLKEEFLYGTAVWRRRTGHKQRSQY